MAYSQQINMIDITGDLSDMAMVGTHIIKIRGTNGFYNPSPDSRGVNGMFTGVDSADITINVLNPCEKTVINSDS